jgi:hypothetical protein
MPRAARLRLLVEDHVAKVRAAQVEADGEARLSAADHHHVEVPRHCAQARFAHSVA